MEDMKKSGEFEPTILDVLEAVQSGFTKMEERFDDLGYRVTAVEKRTGAVETTLEEMKETLDGVARAVDKDAVTIIDHTRRIVHLEEISAVPA